jgi:hypothetical protein
MSNRSDLAETVVPYSMEEPRQLLIGLLGPVIGLDGEKPSSLSPPW